MLGALSLEFLIVHPKLVVALLQVCIHVFKDGVLLFVVVDGFGFYCGGCGGFLSDLCSLGLALRLLNLGDLLLDLLV